MFISANKVSTTLAVDFTSYDDVMIITSDAGLPALTGGAKLPMRLTDAATRTAIEIVYVTDISGVNLTVERAQEGTSALDWLANDIVFVTLTAESTALVKPILTTFDISGSAGITLNESEAYSDILEFTGALTADSVVTVPSLPNNWTVYNNTTGAFSLTVKTSAGTGTEVAQTYSANLICDGNNVVGAINPTLLPPFATINNVTGSRAKNINYTNTSGKSMFVSIAVSYGDNVEGVATLIVNSINISQVYGVWNAVASNFIGTVSGVVPPDGVYQLSCGAAVTLPVWVEQY